MRSKILVKTEVRDVQQYPNMPTSIFYDCLMKYFQDRVSNGLDGYSEY